jgi:aconitase B
LLKHLLLKKWSSLAGGSYAIVFWKKITNFASRTLESQLFRFCSIKEVSVEGQGLTAVEKIFNKNAVEYARKSASWVLTFVLP